MDAVYQVPIAPGIAHGKHMLTVASVALTGDYQIYSSVKESTFWQTCWVSRGTSVLS